MADRPLPADAAPATIPPAATSSPTALDVSAERIAAEHSPDLAHCLSSGDAARGVSVAMGGCFNAELKLQDDRLNTAYRAAMRARDSTGQARLRAEEQAWIRRRDAACAEAATGGTIDQVEIPACLLDEIRRRLALDAMAG